MRYLTNAFCALLCALFAPAAVLAAAPAVNQAYFHKFYSGKIDGKYAFTMDLKNLDGTLSGNYRYSGKPMQIYLAGSVDAAGAVKMDEKTSPDKISGRFSGTVAGTTLSGVWRSPDGSKTLPFTANQTSEILIGTKKDILAKAVGEYPLMGISGSGGANGMWDTWKQKGKWKANVSGISGGMRTATDLALDRNDQHFLDSMTIKVDPDLGVRFVAGGKTLMVIPFRPGGMQLELSNAAKHDIDRLTRLSPTTTVLDEQLYLLAKDGIDYSALIHGNFETGEGNVVIASYDIVGGTFDLTFFPDSCCGDTTYTFARGAKK